MDRLEEFFHSRGASVNLEHSPLADLIVAQHYRTRGYGPIEFSNTLFLSLAGHRDPPAENGTLEIRRIRPEETDLWTRIVCQGFAEQVPITPDLLKTASCFGHSELAICFLALIDGVSAGGANLCIHGGVAAVNGASALPEFRGRGIHSALLRARLALAASQGCDLALTNTAPGSGSQRKAAAGAPRAAGYARDPEIRVLQGGRAAARSGALGTSRDRRAGRLHRMDGARQASPLPVAGRPHGQVCE
jgi:GNAT superfamily N-acetyltransferase